MLPVSANVLARRFNPDCPNQAWVSDITCIHTRSGWLYWAVVLDLSARKAVGLSSCEAEGSGRPAAAGVLSYLE